MTLLQVAQSLCGFTSHTDLAASGVGQRAPLGSSLGPSASGMEHVGMWEQEPPTLHSNLSTKQEIAGIQWCVDYMAKVAHVKRGLLELPRDSGTGFSLLEWPLEEVIDSSSLRQVTPYISERSSSAGACDLRICKRKQHRCFRHSHNQA